MDTKYIFITGGVLSSVGKGITSAAIGRILRERGFSVTAAKLDPYINVDPGTMSPYQHGEVFVLDDGSETDLDLGHYERLLDINLTKVCNFTTGQVYEEVIAKERRGDFLGGTIQVIPHITNEIKRRIALVADSTGAEIVLVEIGGTVGDIESLPFLEALRQMRTDVGFRNTAYVHVTWMPYIGATGELKTKPTQHSVRELRSIGIQPNVIVARSDYSVDQELREKIALFCNVEPQAVVPITTTKVIYEVPLKMEEMGIGNYLMETLDLEPRRKPTWRTWKKLTKKTQRKKPIVEVALVGKYVELRDAYMSVKEAVKHAGLSAGVDVKINWVHSTDLEKGRGWEGVEGSSGIIVPGGFGDRGIEGKILAAKYGREKGIPYLGLCLGMQLMVVEFARYVLDDEMVNSTEFDPSTPHPVIDLMPDQRGITNMGATMRLGLYPCVLQSGSIAAKVYGVSKVNERHRHRFELNNAYRNVLSSSGMIFSGLSPDGRLVEIAELKDHIFMLGTQFHPEFLSRPTKPHPLFLGFVQAIGKYAGVKMSAKNDE
jgi:CTP synthase